MNNVVKSLFEHSKVQVGLLDLANFGGRGLGNTLIQIQPTNEERFKRNAKDWIKSIIKTCADQSDMDKRKVILRLMKILAETDVSCLDEVATASTNALKKFKARKLEPFAQMAMMEEANLTYQQQRKIRKHLVQAGCNILLPECVIKQYQAEFMKPTFVRFQEKLRTKTAWFTPIDAQVMDHLNKNATVLLRHKDDIKAIHVNLAGDHGQGAFRMVIRILVFLKDGTQLELDSPLKRFHPLLDDTFLVGYVECKKDTREVLEASTLKQLNDSLAKPFELGRVVLWKDANGEVVVRWPDGVYTGTEIEAIPVEVFLLGDTAFLSTILGRDDMAMHWCNFCWLKRAEWQCDVMKKGPPITMAGIKARLASLESGELNRKKADHVKGCKSAPLLTNITLRNMFVGALHCVDLHVNFLVKRMFLWIRWRIETAPQELALARNALAKAMMDEVEAKVEVVELGSMIDANKKDIEELTAAGLDDASKDEIKTIKKIIAGTRQELTIANTALTAAKSKAKSALTKVNRISKMKEYNATTQPIRQRVEERLQREHYVYRSSYHGGDLEGNQCR